MTTVILNQNKIELKNVSLVKITAMGIALKNKTIDTYFRFLTHLDNGSKKKLIIKLAESIETENEDKFDLKELFGAWDDSRDSDEIIRLIKDSRIESKNSLDF